MNNEQQHHQQQEQDKEWQTCIEHAMISSTTTTTTNCCENGTNGSINSVSNASISTTTTSSISSNGSINDIMNPSSNNTLLVDNGLLQSVFTHTSTCLSYDNNNHINNDTTTTTSILSKQKRRRMMTDHNNHLLIQTLPARIDMNHSNFTIETYTEVISLYLKQQFTKFDEEQLQHEQELLTSSPTSNDISINNDNHKNKRIWKLKKNGQREQQSNQIELSNNTNLCTVLLDVRPGIGWSNPPVFSLIKLIRYSCHILYELYPNRLYCCIVYPVPYIANTIWNTLIRPFIPTSISNKIITISGSADLKSLIPIEQLKHYISIEVIEQIEQHRINSFIR